MTAKKVLITIAASVAVGAVLGMLYAPVEGSEARRKIRRLKQKLTSGTADAEEQQTIEELIDVLQNELNRINRRLEKI